MRKLATIVAVTLVAMLVTSAYAEDVKLEGTLIDQMCGAKMMKKDDPQKAADNHKKDRALKCADSGFEVISDGKETKLTTDSNDKVKEYLEKNDSMKVAIEGTKQDDGSVAVKSIMPAEKKS